MSPDDLAKAYEALRLRETGMTLKAVGEAMGVSIERVRQFLATAWRNDHSVAHNPLHGLSTRAQNCFRNEYNARFGQELTCDGVERFAASLTEDEMGKVPNAGRKAVAEIIAWLAKRGLAFRAA